MSLLQTSMNGVIVLYISNFIVYQLEFSAILRENFFVVKLSVLVFGQTTRYRIYTVNKEPMRLPDIQYPLKEVNMLFIERLANFVTVKY